MIVAMMVTTAVANAEPNISPPGLTPVIQHEDDVSEIQQLTGPPTAVFGFGLGQVVEGRWHEVGWKFTLVDTLSMAMMMTGGATTESTGPYSNVFGIIGVSGMLLGGASRVWQVVDSVTGARAKNRRVMRQRMQLAPLVMPARAGDGAVAGVAVRF